MHYPLRISYHVLPPPQLTTSIQVRDDQGQPLFFVRQPFSHITEIGVFADEAQQSCLYTLQSATSLLDFNDLSLSYRIFNQRGKQVGLIRRGEGSVFSRWKTRYEVLAGMDENSNQATSRMQINPVSQWLGRSYVIGGAGQLPVLRLIRRTARSDFQIECLGANQRGQLATPRAIEPRLETRIVMACLTLILVESFLENVRVRAVAGAHHHSFSQEFSN